jgi:hypothetical protein
MSYLSTIKKLRLKTRWEEGTVDCRLSSSDAPWNLLINCGKENFIGLKSLNPPAVHYYKQGQLTTRVRILLEGIGGTLDPCEGEYMAYVPLKRLPELCKIVGARKKRSGPTGEAKNRAMDRLKIINEARAQERKQGQGSTQDDKDG